MFHRAVARRFSQPEQWAGELGRWSWWTGDVMQDAAAEEEEEEEGTLEVFLQVAPGRAAAPETGRVVTAATIAREMWP